MSESIEPFNRHGVTKALAAAARNHNRATNQAKRICAKVGSWDLELIEAVLRIINAEKTRRLRARDMVKRSAP